MLNILAWNVPPDQRTLTGRGAAVYVECELPLAQHGELWCWLHNLLTTDEVAERLAAEAADYLASQDD